MKHKAASRLRAACLAFAGLASSAGFPAEVPGHFELLIDEDFEGEFVIERALETTDDAAWRITETARGKVLELHRRSDYSPPVTSPLSVALFRNVQASSFVLEADLKQTGAEYGHRDMCIVFGAQNRTNFYYVHLASRADDAAHHIHLVKDAPRTAITSARTEGVSWGEEWHRVRVMRDLESGLIEVFFDDMDVPVMRAVDRSFGAGYVGFGSFDDTGMIDNVRLWGMWAHDGADEAYRTDEASLALGKRLFEQYCRACHGFTLDRIGPALGQVTSSASRAWLRGFIVDAPGMVAGGDERARQVSERFSSTMPAFRMLGHEEAESLLAFIHDQRQETPVAQARNARPGGTRNPIPERIRPSPYTLVLEPWLRMPPTASIEPLTRINKLDVVRGSSRTFVHDLRGVLYEVDGRDVRVYLDLRAEIPEMIDVPGLGTGFGSFAFHPEFARNGKLYTTHAEVRDRIAADFAIAGDVPDGLQWVLSEWTAADPRAGTFSGTRRELLRADMIGAGHGFQELTFNPLATQGDPDHGMLYLGVGDGGASFALRDDLLQDVGKIWGSILRIDPAGTDSPNGKYGIPKDNPWAGQAGALGELWARGFRNPHRISWDPNGSGMMLVADIGHHNVEEVNLGKAGANYGWPLREGTFAFDIHGDQGLVYPLSGEEDDRYVDPVIQFDHDEAVAVSGGFVYAGTALHGLQDKYVFGGIVSGRLFYVDLADIRQGKQAPIHSLALEIGGEVGDLRSLVGERVDLRFGLDADGELVLMSKAQGQLWKAVAARETSR